MAHDRKWGDRFGDRIVKKVISNLGEMSEIVLKRIETEGGEKKSKASFGTGQRAAEKVGGNGERGGPPFTIARHWSINYKAAC
jgi:hypothetical protein